MKKQVFVVLTALLVLAWPLCGWAQLVCTTNNGAITIAGYSGGAFTVIIPATTNGYPVTGIGANAFRGQDRLASVTIPDCVTNIGADAFLNCFCLTNLIFGSGVISIGNEAFENCGELGNVTIPDSVSNIGNDAFGYCGGLTNVMIGSNVISIGDKAFERCANLTNIAVKAANPNYASTNGVLFNKTMTTLVQYPGGLTGSYWFRYPMITAHIVGAALMSLEKWLYESMDAGRSVEAEIRTILASTRSVAFAGVLLCVGKRHPDLLTGPLRELVCVREFHLWDSVKHSEYHGINTSSFMDPEAIRKLKWEWEQMPHRREKMHDLCCRLFLTKPESRPVFERVRSLWISRSREQTSNSDEALSWLRWAAKYELPNWKEMTAKDGHTFWAFESPEELRDKKGEQQYQDSQLVMQVPSWCRDALNKRIHLAEVQLEDLWNTLQDVSQRPAIFPSGGWPRWPRATGSSC